MVIFRKRISAELVRSNEDLQRFFAYVAAHDLRSPLNSWLNLLQLLARRTKDTFQEGDAQLLDLAIANFRRLGELMEAILAYSTVENAPQRRTVVSLEDPLKIALQNLQHHIESAERQSTLVHCRASAPIVLRWPWCFKT